MEVLVRPEIAKLVEGLITQARAEAWRAFTKAPHAQEREELESVAYEGLMQAADKWDGYCARNGFSPDALQYFGAYALRRIRGALLDHQRASDWVSRSSRQRAKAIQAAGSDLGRTHEELAAATSLTVEQVRQTQAALARKPVSLDDSSQDLPEHIDVEGQVFVAGVLAAVAAAGQRLAAEAQAVLALRYYEGLELEQISELLGLEPADVQAHHDRGVLEVHQAMVLAAA